MTAAQPASSIRSVFFDIDGTLVDSNDEHARSWVEAFAELGEPHTFAEIRPLIGMGGDKLLTALGITAPDGELGAALSARRKAIFLERHLPKVRAFPGSRELVEMFGRSNLLRIVASSASPEELTPLLEAAGVAQMFDHAVTPDEIESTKPAPDVVLAALEWSKTEPEQALMIGDTAYDIEAAHRAGVRCIGLRCGGSSDEALAGADAIFDTPLALLTALQSTALDTLVGGSPSVTAK